MSRIKTLAPAFVAAGMLLGATAPVMAGPEDTAFFQRFAGSFSGSGEVLRNAQASPNNVNCTFKGQPGQDRITFNGTCRAYVLFSRDVGISLMVDPKTDRYVGTYTGSSIGVATLSGTRKGTGATFTITWPKPVNGDRVATLSIQFQSDNTLRVVTTDKASVNGPVITTSDIRLKRAG
ncbi:hypothetical protein SAMN05216548_11734 [Faunimonas pinastri]|uniref:Uncharacterized protein n=1 Tax=Faunimonas pinastri TaxID=1855383 RepID=A0A1H9NT20_9HYPH|nr:hypothetical protein [Faunimonas pinastri]SER39051.1 hypothetical protein SAMN05216548_11734 [Faunimonas pinastri]